MDVQFDPELRENDVGDWLGLTRDKVERRSPEGALRPRSCRKIVAASAPEPTLDPDGVPFGTDGWRRYIPELASTSVCRRASPPFLRFRCSRILSERASCSSTPFERARRRTPSCASRPSSPMWFERRRAAAPWCTSSGSGPQSRIRRAR